MTTLVPLPKDNLLTNKQQKTIYMKRCDATEHAPHSKRRRYDDYSEAGRRTTERTPATATTATAAATATSPAASFNRQCVSVEELVRAAGRNDLTVVQRLLQHDESDYDVFGTTTCNSTCAYAADNDAHHVDRVTALHVASLHGFVEIVRCLLRHPACDPNIPSRKTRETAMHLACQKGHDVVVEELLQHAQIRLDLTDRYGNTPLHAAVLAQHLSLTERLCSYIHQHSASAAVAMAWINQPDRSGRTALHKAVEKRNAPLVQCLLEAGSDGSRTEKMRGRTPLHEALVSAISSINMLEIVSLLLSMNQLRRSPSYDLSEKAAIEMKKQEEQYAETEQVKLVRMVNAADHYGETALSYVIEIMSNPNHSPHDKSLFDILQLIIDHGADPSQADHCRNTVFHKAFHWDLDLQSPVLEAAMRRLLKHAVGKRPPSGTLDLEEEHDTILDLRNNEGLTALHVAVQTGRERALSLLLEYGARVDAISNQGFTILHDAVRFTPEIGFHDEDQATSSRMVRIILQHLVQHGVLHHALIQDKKGNTALHVAIQDNNIPMVRLFCGDEPWAPLFANAVINNQGETPLHVAVQTDDCDILSFLLQHKADVSVQDASGRTPLMLACELGHLNSIFVLFMHGQGLGLYTF